MNPESSSRSLQTSSRERFRNIGSSQEGTKEKKAAEKGGGADAYSDTGAGASEEKGRAVASKFGLNHRLPTISGVIQIFSP